MSKINGNKKQKTAIEDYSLSPGFYQQLCCLTVDHIRTKNNQIFICQRTDNLVDVWKGLVKYNFHSVPVMQKTHKNRFFGGLDLHDICNYVVSEFGKKDLISIEDFWKYVKTSDKLNKLTVNEIIKYPLSNKNPYHPVSKGYSLFSALEILARERHLHRLPVLDKDRKLVNMLTQSRVIQFFKDNKKILGKRINKPISLIDSSHKKVVSIEQTELAIDAFKMMKKNNVSAVAVVNNVGKIVNVISETDLKLISTDGKLFYKLYQKCTDFIDDINSQYEKIYMKKRKLTISKGDCTIGDLIDILSDNNVHRTFVVNKDQIPVGVVSLKDVLHDLICN